MLYPEVGEDMKGYYKCYTVPIHGTKTLQIYCLGQEPHMKISIQFNGAF